MNKAVFSLLFTSSLVFAGEADLKKFFGSFAELFAATDHKALIANGMVDFPLKLKGTLDDSPEIQVSAKQFAAILKKIAEQPSGMNARNFDETEKDYVTSQAKTGKLPSDAGEGTKRSGNLIFAQKSGKWKLVKVYVSDALIEEIGKKTR